ncbi:MAG: DMT family transporter [Syntrophobacterales bacterium]|nr:MAG: DMT family transporter [Syntrophobacterales bacterium]
MIKGLKNPTNAAMLGYGAIFLSALIFSTMGLMTRVVEGTYSSSLFNMIRGALGIVVLLGLSRFHLFPLKGRHFKLLAARGILGGIASLCFFKAIIGGAPLATSTVLLYTFPIFGAIFSWILLGEKLNVGEMATVFVAFIGVYIILNPAYQPLSLMLLFALLAGFLAGIVMVIIRVLRREENPFIIYFYFCLFLVITCLPGVINRFQMPHVGDIPYLLVFGLAGLLGQILITYGLKYCRVATAGIVAMTETFYAGLWGALFFHEMISWTLVWGGGIVLAGGMFLTISEHTKTKGPSPYGIFTLHNR